VVPVDVSAVTVDVTTVLVSSDDCPVALTTA
jgi:hypothetical protein